MLLQSIPQVPCSTAQAYALDVQHHADHLTVTYRHLTALTDCLDQYVQKQWNQDIMLPPMPHLLPPRRQALPVTAAKVKPVIIASHRLFLNVTAALISKLGRNKQQKLAATAVWVKPVFLACMKACHQLDLGVISELLMRVSTVSVTMYTGQSMSSMCFLLELGVCPDW